MKKVAFTILIICIITQELFSQVKKTVEPAKNNSSITVSQDAFKNIKEDDVIFSITESFNYVIPFGSFSNLVKSGYGFSVEYDVDHLFTKKNLKNVIIGAELGYYNFKGKERNTDYFIMVPAYLTIGYRLMISETLFFLPELYVGGSLNVLNYNKEFVIGQYAIDYTLKTTIEPSVKGKLRFGYSGKLFFASISAGYGNLIEKKGIIHFSVASIDVGVKW